MIDINVPMQGLAQIYNVPEMTNNPDAAIPGVQGAKGLIDFFTQGVQTMILLGGCFFLVAAISQYLKYRKNELQVRFSEVLTSVVFAVILLSIYIIPRMTS